MRRSLVWLCLLSWGACETPVVEYDPSAVDSGPVVGTDVVEDTVIAGPQAECDPRAEDTGCSEGLFCETTAKVCVECITTQERCTDDGQRERCERPESEGVGQVSGGFFEALPCEPLHTCVPSGSNTTSCEYVICTPGLARCASPMTAETCNVYGTEFEAELCGPGWACVAGACDPIRHNVLLVFDTSTSMYDFSEGTGRPADDDYVFPSCSDDGLPMTRFDLAKTIFSENISAAIGGFSHFALQRFPQSPHTGRVPTCVTGYYVSTETDMITGDDGQYDTTMSSWFSEHRDEVLVVPFSTQLGLDNTSALLSWLDFSEQLVPTSQMCTAHDQCPFYGCRTDTDTQLNLCHVHAEPELRMGGNTPLGKSLFYAGEYFRRSVLIDGQACADDGDCLSAGYVCEEGTCQDPYAHCRDNRVILFTDGQENLFQDKDDFFGPQAQAKRLAYGLHCDEDADCRGGATCVTSSGVGYCVPIGESIEGAPYVPGTGHDALSRPDGSPISILTTVINLQTAPSAVVNPNAAIARWGGGELFEVFTDDPEDMKAQLYEAMTPAFKCAAEELEEPGE